MIGAAGASAVVVLGRLADESVRKVPDPDMVSPGFAGFLTIFLLTLATIVLIRSMTRHLRKVRYSPDPANPSADQPPGPPDPGAGPDPDADSGTPR